MIACCIFLLLCIVTARADGFAQADSTNFILDTTESPPGIGGAVFADSGNFILDTTESPPGIGGAVFADSGNFILDTTESPPGIGGAVFADSGNFILDTTESPPGIGGVASADSGNFTVDTTGTLPGVGGAASADSADFTLDTRDLLTVTTLADSGFGSLRQTIANAYSFASNTVVFSPGLNGTITLTNGELDITNNLVITGPGATNIMVNGNGTNFVFVITNGMVSISGLTITNGIGGISNSATLSISYCAIVGNHGSGLINAGIGAVTLNNCTISGNISSTSPVIAGGGIQNLGGATVLNMINCTVSGNQSVASLASDQSFGGGIYNAGTAGISSCTIASNSCTGGNAGSGSAAGGGIYNSGTLTLGNTLVAGNSLASISGAHNLTGPDCHGIFVSQGFNLIGQTNDSSGWSGAGDQAGSTNTPLDAKLGPLQNNGGPTLTYALLAGSPAIDAGNSFGLTTDQRGQVRPSDSPIIPNAAGGDGSDIGAFEAAQSLIIIAPTLTVKFVGPANVVVSWPSPSTGFTLQTNGALGASSWANYGGIVGDDGTTKSVTNSSPTGKLFFRLLHP
jgi:hypothetical protein